METIKKRTRHPYEKIGRINGKKKRTNKRYPDSYFYELEVEIENDKGLRKLFVFPNNLTSEIIWKAIENADYAGKRYVFFCHNYKGSYNIFNWKELI